MKFRNKLSRFIFAFLTVALSCNQKPNHKTLANSKFDYAIGDCFEFKDSIRDFGLVLLNEKRYSDGNQCDLFPVKLDTSKLGVERFINGEVILSHYYDYQEKDGIASGFKCYHFLGQKKYEDVDRVLKYIGNVSLKPKYYHVAGGTWASSFVDFRFQLNRWERMFSANGEIVKFEKVLN